MTGPDSPEEDDTERDGFLSYAAEWHALSLGLYDGLKSPRVRPNGIPDNKDAKAEPHYYKGAYVIGTVLQVLSLAVLGVGVGDILGVSPEVLLPGMA